MKKETNDTKEKRAPQQHRYRRASEIQMRERQTKRDALDDLASRGTQSEGVRLLRHDELLKVVALRYSTLSGEKENKGAGT